MTPLLAPVPAAQAAAPAPAFDPFAGPEITHVVPLTPAQAEIWLACQLGGADASRAYNESVALRLRGGAVQADALRAALAALARRHEALRATCSPDGTVLCILAEPTAELHYQDLTADAEGGAPGAGTLADALARHAAAQAQHVFDLAAGPLWQVSLLKLGAAESQLTLTAHHLVCDGWSLGLLLQELSRLYSAAVRGAAADLPPAVAFGEYARREALFRDSAAGRAAEEFWLNMHGDGGPTADLPTDFERPAVRTYASRRLDNPLDPALVAGLRAVGVRAGGSFNTTLLAVFEALLFRLGGHDDLVVGLPTAGQAAAGLPTVAGHCVHTLPLRSRPAGELRFLDYLHTRKTALLDALDHQQCSYGRLLPRLPLRRAPGRLPLVAVLFNVDLGLDEGVDFAGLAHELRTAPRAFENFELSLNVSGAGNRLVLECAYNVALFRPERISRLLASFARLAEQVVADPTTRLADLPLAAPALSAAYLALNNTQADYPAATLHGLIAAQALATPHHRAVECGPEALTYAELLARAQRLAAALRARGLQAGQVVGVAVERSVGLVVALLAVLRCGAAYLPLDPAYPAARLRFMLADADAHLLLTSAGGLPDLAYDIPRLVPNELPAEESSPATGAETNPKISAAFDHEPALGTADSLCYLLYTSGSTGQPKGVPVAHRSVVNLLTSMQRAPGIGAADRLLAVTTVSFDIAGVELWLPLVSGAAVVLADAYTARDGRALLHLLETGRISLLQATPGTWALLLAAGWARPLPQLVALCGGEALPPALAARLLPLCGALWNLYGPTETTIWSAVQRIRPGAAIAVGRPVANTQLYVLNEQQEPVAPETVGELYIGGAGVAAGYWRRPDLTAARFGPDPFAPAPGGRLYRTGDAARLLASGEVQVLGRLDEQLKLRGHRIEPGEVEAHLLRLPGVRQAAVVAREYGPDDRRLVACLVLAGAPDDAPNPTPAGRAAWQTALRAELPAHLVPSEFEVLAALPLTLNGKVDRRALARPAAPPRRPTAPRTDVEQLVAGIWSEALGVATVGVYDDFFDLGGHSLVAVRVMAQLEARTGRRLPLAALFTHPTVAALALALQLDGKSVTWDSLVPIKPEGGKMPLYLVHGSGLNVLMFNAIARHLDPDQPVFGLQAQGLNGVDRPLDRIEDMAAHYIAAIRGQNPTGPYALAGFSFGGLIAFEMARQLLAAGHEVRLLALFDTYAYQSNHRTPWPRRTAQNAATLLKKILYSCVLLTRNPRRIYTYKREQLLGKLADALGRARPAAAYPPLIDHLNEVAWREYVLKPTPVAVDLFRARDRTFYMPDATHLGWRPLALRGVRVREMPGEHNYMFAPPYEQGFAAALQEALDQAAAR